MIWFFVGSRVFLCFVEFCCVFMGLVFVCGLMAVLVSVGVLDCV